MRVKITAEIREINNGAVNVHCSIAQEHGIDMLLPVVFEAILKVMKDTNKSAFYEAMSNFANEDFDDAIEFLTGDNEND